MGEGDTCHPLFCQSLNSNSTSLAIRTPMNDFIVELNALSKGWKAFLRSATLENENLFLCFSNITHLLSDLVDLLIEYGICLFEIPYNVRTKLV